MILVLSNPPTNPEGPCKLNRSPCELLDDLSLFNLQVDDLHDSFYVNMDSCAYHLSSPTNMLVTSMNTKEMMAMATTRSEKAQLKTLKKNTLKNAKMKEKKEAHTQKMKNVKKDEGEEGASQTWKCKKNDGKDWKCSNNASHPNSLCDYHWMKKNSYLNLEFASPLDKDKMMLVTPTIASKPSNNSNAQKKPANNYNITEGFYYYSGFAPSRGKRRYRNNPRKEEDVEVGRSKYASPSSHVNFDTEDDTHSGATTCGDDACNNNYFAWGNINMERNKNPWKLPRKPLKVWALMSK